MTDPDKELPTSQIAGPNPDEVDDETFSNNYALAIGLGLPFGAILGMLIFDNIGLGAGLGLALSPVIALFMGRMNTD